MTVGEIAGLIAAVAAVAFVALCALPLLKLNRTLDEISQRVQEIGDKTVPVLEKLELAVDNTNQQMVHAEVAVRDVSRAAEQATQVTQNAAQLTQLIKATVSPPIIKAASVAHGLTTAWKERGQK